MSKHIYKRAGAPNFAPPQIGHHYIDLITGDQYLSKGTTTTADWVLISGDDKVKVAATDTTAGYLLGKVSAGSGIVLTEQNIGSNETLQIAVTGAALTDEKVKVSATDTTAGYLQGKLVAGTGISLTQQNAGGNETFSVSTTVTQYTDELAQDAVGGILTDTASIDFTYNDAGNQITAAVLPAGVDHNSLNNFVANKHIDHSTVSISAGTGLSGGGDITTSRTLNIANTAVTAASYGSTTQVATFTVNAQGQLTAAANATIAVPSTQITDFTEAVQDVMGGALVDSASVDFQYNDVANTQSAVVLPAGVNHDALQNWVANKHIDHSAVSISAGTGLSGGGDITTSRTLSIPNSGVTAATYGSATQVPVFAVNALGFVTSASNTTIAIPSTQVTDFSEAVDDRVAALVQNGTGLTWTYNDPSNTLTANVSLSPFTTTNLTEGTGLYYTDARARAAISVTDTASVDLTYTVGGNISAAVLPAGVDHNSLLNFVANKHIDHSTVSITAGTGLSGGGDITATRTLSLANTAVTAGNYGSATQVGTFAVDAQGRLTSASNVAVTPAWSSITGTPTTLAGYGITDAIRNAGGSPSILSDLVANRPTAGTSGRLFVATDSKIIYRDNGTSWDIIGQASSGGSVTSVATGTGLTGGPITSSGTISIANTAVTAGSYGSSSQVAAFTVNAQGQLTAASNTSIDHNALTNFVANKHIDHSTVSLVAGTGISATGLGDLTASRTINLANTSVTAASYGSSTQVAGFTVDAQGRLTSASDTSIAIPSAQVTDFAESVDDRVAALLVQGAGITLTYNDPANTLTVASSITQYTDEMAQDTVASLIQSGTGISWSYNDALNTLTPTVSLSPFTTTNLAEGTNLYYTDTRARAAISVTDSGSIDFTYTAGAITGIVLPAGVDHNSLNNFVANKHIDHSTVSVTAGTGLSGGGDITATRTLNIANTTVTAGSYGSASSIPNYTVNAQGQLTAAASTPIAIVATSITDFTEAVQDAMGGTLVDSSSVDFQYNDVANTQTAVVIPGGVDHNALLNWTANKHIDHSTVSLVAGTGISATGLGDITTSRTINLANTTVTAASYGSATQVPTYTVNAQGQLTAAGNVSIQIAESQVTNLVSDLSGKVPTTRSIIAGTGLSGGGDLSADRTLSIANTAVTSSSYGSATQVPTYTVNAQGQLTAAANVSIAIPSIAVTDFAESVDDRVAALAVAGTGISITYNDPANTLTFATTVTQYTDEMAQDTVASLIQSGTGISWAYNDALNTLTPTVSLSAFTTTNLAEGTNLYYTDTRARTAYSVTDSSSIDFTYTPATGVLTGVVLPAGVDHNSLNNFVANKHIDHSTVSLIAGTGISATGLGDLTSSRTINLANTAVTAASYGSATQVATFTVNAQGQLTAAANTTIAIPSTAVTDFVEAAQDAVGGILTDTSSIDFTYNDAGNQITAVVLPAGVNHDALQNWVANKHIDHSAVSITAGTGLSGGGDITTSRTISMPNVITAGTYGNSTNFPVITVDAQGRVTAVSTYSSSSFWSVDTNLDLGGLLTWSDQTGQDLCIRQAGSSGSAYVRQVSSNGTLASPIATTNGQRLGGNGMYGWNSTGVNELPSGAMNVYATENHTASAQGGQLTIEIIPNGSTTPVTTAIFEQNGDLSMLGCVRAGTTTDTTDGNIRYTGTEFQGRQNGSWVPFHQVPTYLSATASTSTTSATFATISGMTTTPAAGTYKLDFTCSAGLSASNSTGDFGVFIAGSEQAQCRRTIANGAATAVQSSVAISTMVTVNGSQAVTIQFRENASATLTAYARELILTPTSR